MNVSETSAFPDIVPSGEARSGADFMDDGWKDDWDDDWDDSGMLQVLQTVSAIENRKFQNETCDAGNCTDTEENLGDAALIPVNEHANDTSAASAGLPADVRRANGGTQLRMKVKSISSEKRRDDKDLANGIDNPHVVDRDTCRTWLYPAGAKELRNYQAEIVRTALFSNTLVALPTGLGKTFIAAVIMLNWLRWCPKSKVLFLAPTKPLLQQQEQACREIFGSKFGREITYIDGETHYTKRQSLLDNHRVIFSTPQVAELLLEHFNHKERKDKDQQMKRHNRSASLDPKSICCVVVDEAHRATGSFAYVRVINTIGQMNPYFRVFALTATPGVQREKVDEVLGNLRIECVEFRDREHPDIHKYVQSTCENTEIFDISSDIRRIRDLFIQSFRSIFERLQSRGAVQRDITSLTVFGVRQDRVIWMRSNQMQHNNRGAHSLHPYFNAITMLAGPMDILQIHGILPFEIAARELQEQVRSKSISSRLISDVVYSPAFKKMLKLIEEMREKAEAGKTGENSLEGDCFDLTGAKIENKSFRFFGHPKMERLVEILNEHFDGSHADTRAMVFVSFRVSAKTIVDVLNSLHECIRAELFVGQSTSINNISGMSRKDQSAAIARFKAGEINCLVATSIGEEGLDIGEVDLVITYDQSASLIRNRQRVGRTGRRRSGIIYHFAMAGKEESKMKRALCTFDEMQKSLRTKRDLGLQRGMSLRIIPQDITPQQQLIDSNELEEHRAEHDENYAERSESIVQLKKRVISKEDYQQPVLGVRKTRVKSQRQETAGDMPTSKAPQVEHNLHIEQPTLKSDAIDVFSISDKTAALDSQAIDSLHRRYSSNWNGKLLFAKVLPEAASSQTSQLPSSARTRRIADCFQRDRLLIEQEAYALDADESF